MIEGRIFFTEFLRLRDGYGIIKEVYHMDGKIEISEKYIEITNENMLDSPFIIFKERVLFIVPNYNKKEPRRFLGVNQSTKI